MTLLVISEISGLFVNTLTLHDKCSRLTNENLRQPTQTQLSKKQRTFSQIFAAFTKSTSIFKPFEKR